MSTIVSWFPTVAQARSAVLDLLTSGIPRQDISAIISLASAEVDSVHHSSGLNGSDEGNAEGTVNTHDFITSLFGATTITLPEIGPAVVAGPLAAVLQQVGEATTSGNLGQALIGLGAPRDQANLYADELSKGGALLALQVDNSLDEVVHGVFRHNIDFSFQEQQEKIGPTPSRQLVADDVGGGVSTQIGALTGGVLPGAWGTASPILEEQTEQLASDKSAHEASG